MSESLTVINEYLDLLFSYGSGWVYLVLLSACFVENVFPPFPGDTFIVAAGGLTALHRLDWYLVLLMIIAGGMLSVMMLYFVGRDRGRSYFMQRNFKYFSANDIHKVEGHLNRYGALILISSRFVIGFRSALALGAGIARYQPAKMFVYSMISYIIFSGLILYLSGRLVNNLSAIEEFSRTYSMIVWPIMIGLLVLYVVHRFIASRKNAR